MIANKERKEREGRERESTPCVGEWRENRRGGVAKGEEEKRDGKWEGDGDGERRERENMAKQISPPSHVPAEEGGGGDRRA